jgi:hypothetical protein
MILKAPACDSAEARRPPETLSIGASASEWRRPPKPDHVALTAARSAAPFSSLPATFSRDPVAYRIAIRFAP